MGRKYIDIRVTGISDDDIKDFLILLRKVQYCGDIGGNRFLPLQIDGDGSGCFDFEIHTENVIDIETKNVRDFVNLDENQTNKVDDGYDFEAHFLGE